MGWNQHSFKMAPKEHHNSRQSNTLKIPSQMRTFVKWGMGGGRFGNVGEHKTNLSMSSCLCFNCSPSLFFFKLKDSASCSIKCNTWLSWVTPHKHGSIFPPACGTSINGLQPGLNYGLFSKFFSGQIQFCFFCSSSCNPILSLGKKKIIVHTIQNELFPFQSSSPCSFKRHFWAFLCVLSPSGGPGVLFLASLCFLWWANAPWTTLPIRQIRKSVAFKNRRWRLTTFHHWMIIENLDFTRRWKRRQFLSHFTSAPEALSERCVCVGNSHLYG